MMFYGWDEINMFLNITWILELMTKVERWIFWTAHIFACLLRLHPHPRWSDWLFRLDWALNRIGFDVPSPDSLGIMMVMLTNGELSLTFNGSQSEYKVILFQQIVWLGVEVLQLFSWILHAKVCSVLWQVSCGIWAPRSFILYSFLSNFKTMFHVCGKYLEPTVVTILPFCLPRTLLKLWTIWRPLLGNIVTWRRVTDSQIDVIFRHQDISRIVTF